MTSWLDFWGGGAAGKGRRAMTVAGSYEYVDYSNGLDGLFKRITAYQTEFGTHNPIYWINQDTDAIDDTTKRMTRRALQSITSNTIIKIASGCEKYNNVITDYGVKKDGRFCYFEGSVRFNPRGKASDWLNGYIIWRWYSVGMDYVAIYFVDKSKVPHFQTKPTNFKNFTYILQCEKKHTQEIGQLWQPSTTRIVQTWSFQQFDSKLKQYLQNVKQGQHTQDYLIQIGQRIRDQGSEQFKQFINKKFAEPFSDDTLEYIYTKLGVNPFMHPERILVLARFIYSFFDGQKPPESEFITEFINSYTRYILKSVKDVHDIKPVVDHLLNGKSDFEKSYLTGMLLGFLTLRATKTFQVGAKRRPSQQQASTGGTQRRRSQQHPPITTTGGAA